MARFHISKNKKDRERLILQPYNTHKLEFTGLISEASPIALDENGNDMKVTIVDIFAIKDITAKGTNLVHTQVGRFFKKNIVVDHFHVYLKSADLSNDIDLDSGYLTRNSYISFTGTVYKYQSKYQGKFENRYSIKDFTQIVGEEDQLNQELFKSTFAKELTPYQLILIDVVTNEALRLNPHHQLKSLNEIEEDYLLKSNPQNRTIQLLDELNWMNDYKELKSTHIHRYFIRDDHKQDKIKQIHENRRVLAQNHKNFADLEKRYHNLERINEKLQQKNEKLERLYQKQLFKDKMANMSLIEVIIQFIRSKYNKNIAINKGQIDRDKEWNLKSSKTDIEKSHIDEGPQNKVSQEKLLKLKETFDKR